MTIIRKARFVIGTRAVKQIAPHKWQVVCASCDEPRHSFIAPETIWSEYSLAVGEAVKESDEPCFAQHSCGAH